MQRYKLKFSISLKWTTSLRKAWRTIRVMDTGEEREGRMAPQIVDDNRSAKNSLNSMKKKDKFVKHVHSMLSQNEVAGPSLKTSIAQLVHADWFITCRQANWVTEHVTQLCRN